MNKKHFFPICMTILWIITFGCATDSWTLGISLGLCFGIAFGLFGSENDEEEGKKKDRA